MPFYQEIKVNDNSIIYLWKITEDVEFYYDNALLTDRSKERLSGMLSISHQKGFLAVRLLLQHLGYSDFNLQYAQTGKPALVIQHENGVEETKFISISHSHQFASLVISSENVGIDIEILKDKILKIAPRYMDISHLKNLSEDEQKIKATIAWGVKEALFKIVDQKGISYPDHIFEKPFHLQNKKCLAWLTFENQIRNFEMYFYEIEEYILVCGFEIF